MLIVSFGPNEIISILDGDDISASPDSPQRIGHTIRAF